MTSTHPATDRELQVLSLITEGKSSKEIACDLYISTHTVESHKRNLIEKINARNTLHMVVKAIRMGMVCLVVCLLFNTLNSNAQSIVWEKNYGGNEDEILTDFFETSDGGFIAIGHSESQTDNVEPNCLNNSIWESTWIVKLTSSLGQISWNKTIGGDSRDLAFSGLEVSDGYVIGGITSSDECDLINEDDHTMLYKLNDNGNLSWIYTYSTSLGATNNMRVVDIEQTSDGTEMLVIANTGNYSEYENLNGAWIFTVNQQGIKTNSYELFHDFGHSLKGVKKDDQGNYILYGHKNGDLCQGSNNFYTPDIWIFKLSPSYELIWEKTFGSEDRNFVIEDLEVVGGEINFIGTNGGCFIPTIVNPKPTHEKKMELPEGRFFIRLNSSGDVIFQNDLDFNYYTYGTNVDLSHSADGGWFFTVPYSDLNTCIDNFCTDPRIICSVDPKIEPVYYVIKTDYDFNLNCFTSYGGAENDIPVKIIQESEGNILVAGYSESDNADVSDNYATHNSTTSDYWILESANFEFSDPYCKAGGYTFLQTQNAGVGGLYWANFIDEFQFGNYKNVSDNNNGYGNYREESILAEPGSMVNFSMFNSPIGGINSTSYPANKFAIWVDWNDDGDFQDANEEVIYNVSNGLVSGTYSVPAGLALGNQYNMRIGTFTPDLRNENQVLIESEYVPDPCYKCFFGEYEDYILTMDLIPNLICEYGEQTLNCDYQIFAASYPYNFNSSNVSSYSSCTNPSKVLDGEEVLFDFYPNDGATEVTINLFNLGNGDVDLIILNKCNEKTGVVACSQNNGGADESVTFDIDPDVDFYWLVVDGTASSATEFVLQVDCDVNFDCYGGPVSYDYSLFHMSIENECFDLAYNTSFSAMRNEQLSFDIQLDNGNGLVPPFSAPALVKLHMWIDLNDNGIYHETDELWHNEEITLNANSFGSGTMQIPDIPAGSYKIFYQLYAIAHHDIDPLVDPCFTWFTGGRQQEYTLTILESNTEYCPSYGCTYCPASGGETAFINQIWWGNKQISTGDNGGYLDYSSKVLTMEVQNHPEIQIINYGYCLTPEIWRLWVDVNDDGDFNDPFERMINDNTKNVFQDNVFINALNPGSYRLRIQFEADNDNSNNTSPDPCDTDYIGETEDYTLIVCQDLSDCDVAPSGYDITVNNNPLFTGDTATFDIGYQTPLSFTTKESVTKSSSVFFDYIWSFEGGRPATSTSSTPEIIYDSPGTYDVELILSTEGGAQTIIKSEYLVAYESLQSIVSGPCPDIEEITSPTSGIYEASSQIKIFGTINGEENVIFKAGQSLQFEKQFQANKLSIVEVIMEDCKND